MKIFAALLFLFFVLSDVSAQTAEQFSRKANTEMERGNFARAAALFSQAIRQDSTDMLAFYGRSICYTSLGRYQDAHSDLSRVIKANPELGELYFERGILELSYLKMEEKAIGDFTRAIELCEDPKIKYMALANRAGAKQTIRDFEGAVQDLEAIYAQDSTNMDILNNLAIALDDLGEKDRSIEMLERAVKLAPESVPPYINLGFQLAKLDRCEEAVYWLNQALELNPAEAVTWNNLGYAKYCLGDYEGAMADVMRSLELAPENSYAYRNLALVHLALDEDDAACADLEKARELQFARYYGPEVDALLKAHCY